MIEGLDEVIPVQVGVDAENLAEDELAGAAQLLGEAASASKPVFGGAELLESGAGVVGMDSKRHCVWVGREQRRVVNLARHPPLHETHVLPGWELHRVVILVKPGIGVVPISACAHALAKALHFLLGTALGCCRGSDDTYLPADILGHVMGLHMLVPSSSFS